MEVTQISLCCPQHRAAQNCLIRTLLIYCNNLLLFLASKLENKIYFRNPLVFHLICVLATAVCLHFTQMLFSLVTHIALISQAVLPPL